MLLPERSANPKSFSGGLCLLFTVALRCIVALAISYRTAGAQSAGNSGSISGKVVDSTGAVVPKATVEIRNPVSGFDRSTTTDSAGRFEFTNIPFNPYHLSVTAAGFATYAQDVEPRSSVPVNVTIKLQVADRSAGDGGGRGRRPDRERSHVSHRRGQESVRQAAAGEPVVIGEFAGDAGDARNFGGFQWPLSRAWGITRRIRFRSTGSPSPTSRARFSPTRFPWTRSSRWK